jgi:hypothetical protein
MGKSKGIGKAEAGSGRLRVRGIDNDGKRVGKMCCVGKGVVEGGEMGKFECGGDGGWGRM